MVAGKMDQMYVHTWTLAEQGTDHVSHCVYDVHSQVQSEGDICSKTSMCDVCA